MAKATSRSTHSHAEAELSEAARAVVRDQGDPRIDVHLAALGLGADPAPAASRGDKGAALDAEIATLRGRVADLERELAFAHDRTRIVAVVLGLAIVTIVVLVTLQLT
jgi:hypothetical protein